MEDSYDEIIQYEEYEQELLMDDDLDNNSLAKEEEKKEKLNFTQIFGIIFSLLGLFYLGSNTPPSSNGLREFNWWFPMIGAFIGGIIGAFIGAFFDSLKSILQKNGKQFS